jgi:Fic family protein
MFLQEYLDNWEKYYHAEDRDPLVQLAVVHAQFEVIHPFLDGNGRLGRIVIPLFLYEKQLLSRPMFYLSNYLEAHRDEFCAPAQPRTARRMEPLDRIFSARSR